MEDYANLMEAIAARAKRVRRPLAAQIEVTRRCQLDCIHCYLDRERQGEELSTEEIEKLLEDLAELGVLLLSFTGGEFFLRRDWNELLEAAYDNRFATRILTTGYKIDARIAKRLKELAIAGVELSVYSHKPEVHDAVTRTDGSHQMTLNAAKFLLDQGIRTVFKMPVMNVNVADAQALIDLAESLGASCILDPQILPAESEAREPRHYGLSIEQLADFLSQDRIKQVLFGAERGACRVFDERRINPKDRICNIGEQEIHIGAFGEVSPCMLYPPVANVRMKSLSEIWWNNPEIARLRRLCWGDQLECMQCDLRAHCSPCLAMSLMEGAEERACNSISCMLAKAIKEADKREKKGT